MRDNDARGWGVIAHDVLKMRKVIKFKVHELQFTTKFMLVSSYRPSVQVNYQ